MIRSPKELLFDIAFGVICMTVGYQLYMHSGMSQRFEAEKRLEQKRKQEKINRCKHIGFYGRNGEYKTYEWDGELIREHEL